MATLKEELSKIKHRNRRVEADKAWETSWERRSAIAVLTYLVFVLFFWAADLPRPFLNPIVPTIGFLLSTLTLEALKKLWLKRKKK